MKLTQGMKERMQNKILAEKFSGEDAALDKQSLELGDAIFYSLPYIEKINFLPADWFARQNYMSCSFGGMREYIYFTEFRPLPHKYATSRTDFPTDHTFSARFRKLHEAKENLKLRKKELKNELGNVLAGVNTDKQLLAIWPEASKWLPNGPVTSLPAVVSVDKLKQLLGDSI